VGAGLFTVPEGGGTPAPVRGPGRAGWPVITPDGGTLLYAALPREAIMAVPIGGGDPRVVARTTAAAGAGPAILGAGEVHPQRVLSSGHLVYGQDPGFVRVVPFDARALTITGSPLSVAEGVERGPAGGAVYFAASDTGVLVYASGGSRHRLVWVTRSGEESPITSDRGAFRAPALSPDGTRLAIAMNDDTRRSDIWIYDLRGGRRHRLTTTGHNLSAVWRPDGAAIAFSGAGGGSDWPIVEQAPDGSGRRVLANSARGPMYPTAWTPDGRWLVANTAGAGGRELSLVSATDQTSARTLIATPFRQAMGVFAPNGRWLAYVSDEAGRNDLYAVRYPELDRKTLVSDSGGDFPRWSRDGRELFYRKGEDLMAVDVQFGAELRVGTPRRLFSGPYSGVGQEGNFDVSPDGTRFVMVRSDEDATMTRLTIVQNWPADLKR
jgi:Tol biopolymer transport system component